MVIVAIAVVVGVYVWWRTRDEDIAVDAGMTVIPDPYPIPTGVIDPAVAGGIINVSGYAEAIKELSKGDDEINRERVERIHQTMLKVVPHVQ